MAIVALKHVNRFVDRHGKVRYYLRVPGHKAVKLDGVPGSPAFMSAYNDAIAKLPADMLDPKAKTRGPAATDRTIAALAKVYYETDFLKLPAASSRKKNKGIIDRFCAKHGHRHVAKMDFAHINAIHAGMHETPAAANDMLLRVGVLMRLADKLGWRKGDPTEGVKHFKTGKHHTWNDAELDQFKARWPIGTAERTVFSLLFYTSQRCSDVCEMRWSDYDAATSKLRVTQKKKDDEGQDVVRIMHVGPSLAEALAAWRETLRSGERKISGLALGNSPIVVTAYGVAFTDGGLSSWFADKIDGAGLPERCVAHGLRKAFSRTAAEGGASSKEMQAMTGHSNTKELDRYTEAADQPRLARSAVEKMEARHNNRD